MWRCFPCICVHVLQYMAGALGGQNSELECSHRSTDGREPPRWCWEPVSGLLHEQPAPLTSEPRSNPSRFAKQGLSLDFAGFRPAGPETLVPAPCLPVGITGVRLHTSVRVPRLTSHHQALPTEPSARLSSSVEENTVITCLERWLLASDSDPFRWCLRPSQAALLPPNVW